MTTRDLHELVVEEVTVTWRNDRPSLLHAAYHLSLAFYRIGRPSSHIESYKLHVHLSLAEFALKILAFERGECIVCDNGHSLQLIQDGWPQLQMQVDVHPSPMIDDTVACAGPGECAIGGLQGSCRCPGNSIFLLTDRFANPKGDCRPALGRPAGRLPDGCGRMPSCR